MSTSVLPQTYQSTLTSLKQHIRTAQYQALQAVNTQLIHLYWDIGKIITQQQKEEAWGSAVVEQLAKDLQTEFPGVRGFSRINLWRMKRFYDTYAQNKKLSPLVKQIGWSHNVIIFEQCSDDLRKEFYIKSVIREGWSRRVLEDKIKHQEYEKWAIQQTNFDNNLEKNLAQKAQSLVKDDYNFDFLLLKTEHTERHLENALIDNIVKLLAELGGEFCFVGKQYRVEIEDEEYFIDLLFYHRGLKSLVAVELKAEPFKPEHSGKMAFYLAALDDKVKKEGENPSLGIIICKKKNRMIVEYALKDIRKPVGVATYSYNELPEKLARYLPSEEDILKRLG